MHERIKLFGANVRVLLQIPFTVEIRVRMPAAPTAADDVVKQGILAEHIWILLHIKRSVEERVWAEQCLMPVSQIMYEWILFRM